MKEALEDRTKIRNMTIVVQVNSEEKEQIQEAAQAVGMTTSSYCRYVLLQKSGE